MRKRASIVRTLVDESVNVILMDEPLGPLDAQTRLLLQDELLQLWQGSGRTVVFVTHDLVEAIALSDRIAIFTSAPVRIKEIREVRIPRPRDVFHIHEAPGFADIYDAIWDDLRDEIRRTPGGRPCLSSTARRRSSAAEADRARRAARTDRLRILAGSSVLLALILGGWAWASGRILDRLFLSDPVSVARGLLDDPPQGHPLVPPALHADRDAARLRDRRRPRPRRGAPGRR
jgi:hypothetical protein